MNGVGGDSPGGTKRSRAPTFDEASKGGITLKLKPQRKKGQGGKGGGRLNLSDEDIFAGRLRSMSIEDGTEAYEREIEEYWNLTGMDGSTTGSFGIGSLGATGGAGGGAGGAGGGERARRMSWDHADGGGGGVASGGGGTPSSMPKHQTKRTRAGTREDPRLDEIARSLGKSGGLSQALAGGGGGQNQSKHFTRTNPSSGSARTDPYTPKHLRGSMGGVGSLMGGSHRSRTTTVRAHAKRKEEKGDG